MFEAITKYSNSNKEAWDTNDVVVVVFLMLIYAFSLFSFS